MEPRTTLEYKGQVYPFYKTNRGRVDYENAGFTTSDVLDGKPTATLALIYYNLIDCAKRANSPITDSFEQFIDNSDPDIDEVFQRLAAVRTDIEKKNLIDLVQYYLADSKRKMDDILDVQNTITRKNRRALELQQKQLPGQTEQPEKITD